MGRLSSVLQIMPHDYSALRTNLFFFVCLIVLLLSFFFFFWLCYSAYGMLIIQPGIEYVPPALGSAESEPLDHQEVS